MILQDYIIIAMLVVNLYLTWSVYSLQNELDSLGSFCFKSIVMLAEAVDGIEEYLDDDERQ